MNKKVCLYMAIVAVVGMLTVIFVTFSNYTVETPIEETIVLMEPQTITETEALIFLPTGDPAELTKEMEVNEHDVELVEGCEISTESTCDSTASVLDCPGDRNDGPVFSVDGCTLDIELQSYIYRTMCDFGFDWYYTGFLCQIYQESRFDQGAVSKYGDYGLCQLKQKYHSYFRELTGCPDADYINNPYDNLYCGIFLMNMYWEQTHDLNTMISSYYTGDISNYNAEYVSNVRQWESTLKEIKR